jgi:hypothetical protein
MPKIVNAEYQTPKSYFDLPYIHVYDGDALADGNNYSNINVGIADDFAGFALRQIMGADKLAGRVQFRDSFAPLSGASNGFVMPLTYPIGPERFITPAGMLSMDLYTVLRAFRANPPGANIYFAQIAFQGIRRYLGSAEYPGPSDYQYVPRRFTYIQPVRVNWAATDTQPRKFAILIAEGCDFELQRITIVRTSQGNGQGVGVATNAIPNCEIKLQLFEQFGKQLSNAPVLDVYLNDAADATVHFYNPVFPVPAVLYKRKSFLRFEVTSLLTAAMLPSAYDICFHGVRRSEV